jgi:hypothetical protein
MASRFWVGGTGTWDASDTTHWAASSNGAGGQSVPGTSDTVTFDGSSGGGTITLGTNTSVVSITMGAFTGTFNSSTFTVTVQTFNCSGTGTRTLNMGSGQWTVTGNAATVWDITTFTNLTFTKGSLPVIFNYSGSTGTRTIVNGAITPLQLSSAIDVSITAGTDAISIANSRVGHLVFTGFSGTLNNGTRIVYGNLTLTGGMTISSGSSGTTLSGTSGTQTITSNGNNMDFPLTIDATGGTVTLADTLTIGSTRALTFTNGTFNTNEKTVNCGTFACNDNNTKTLTITNSTINITSVATGTQFNVANGSGGVATNLTVTATGSTINFTGSTIGTTASHTFSGGGKTWNNLVFNGPMRPSISFSNTFNNLTFTGPSSKEGRMTVAVDQTVTGTYTVTGTATNRVLVIGAGTGFEGTQRTVTAAAVSFSYVDFQDMRISGAASPATGTSLGDCFNNTNITTDAPRTLYWVGNGGNWSDTAHWSTSSGGSGGQACPIPQDTVYIDANSITSGSQTITIDVCRPCLNIDMSAVTNTPVIAMRSSNVQGTSFYGNVIWSANVTVTGADSAELNNRTTANWNPGGITYPNSWVIRAANGGIITQLGNFMSSGATGLSISLGKLVVNGYNNSTNTFTCATFTTGNGRNQAIDWGTGTWSLTGTGTVLNVTSTGLTSTPNTGTIKITDTSASSKTIAGGGFSYPNLLFSGSGSGTYIITGSNTFIDIGCDTPPHTVNFTAGTTQTVTSLSLNGISGSLVTLQSTSAGTQWSISAASGLIQLKYISLRDSIGTGGATYVALNSTNAGNNTNWNFTAGRSSQSGRIAQTRSTQSGRTTQSRRYTIQ